MFRWLGSLLGPWVQVWQTGTDAYTVCVTRWFHDEEVIVLNRDELERLAHLVVMHNRCGLPGAIHARGAAYASPYYVLRIPASAAKRASQLFCRILVGRFFNENSF